MTITPIETAVGAVVAVAGTVAVIALSEPVQLSLIASIVPTVTLIVGLITLWLKLRSDAKVTADKAAADAKVIADAAAEKLEAIKHSVDGTASKALEKNELQAREMMDFLRSALVEKEERAVILAKAAAEAMTLASTRRSRAEDTAPAVVSAGAAATTVSVDEALVKLDAIEDYTKQTAGNTATTKADVKDLKDAK